MPQTPKQLSTALDSPFNSFGSSSAQEQFAAQPFLIGCGAYGARFAQSVADVQAACRLRFVVFNLELQLGRESSYEHGYDSDAFDEVCEHVLVEHKASGRVVGTYRLQTARTAATSGLGFYGAHEFDFTPYAPIANSMIELGRAAIHRDHRSFEVVRLLWRAIVRHAVANGSRYLIGCSSLSSQSPQEGWDMFHRLQDFCVAPHLRTVPLPDFACGVPRAGSQSSEAKPPRLLRAYLSVGARICGPPAIDRAFKTVDFLTLLDLEEMSPACRAGLLR
jgi:putative hemolysin